MKIGIPRAMMFYRYYPLWNTFFSELGNEVVVSPPTSKRLVERGVIYAPEDTCLPVKAYMGHVEWLKDKVDAIFVPRLVRLSSRYATCPKFLGLPDLVRADISGLPPILDTTFNARKESFARTFLRLGKELGGKRRRVRNAYKSAVAEYERFRAEMKRGTPILKAMGLEDSKEPGPGDDASILIGVVGHPYNLYDTHINVDLFRKLRGMDVRVVTPEMLESSEIEAQLEGLDGAPYWELGREIVGAAIHFLNGNADGVIHLVSFECGPDSLLQSLIEFENQNRQGIPYVPLLLDEHSGEAGLVTRLEAFIDMIVRRPKHRQQTAIPSG